MELGKIIENIISLEHKKTAVENKYLKWNCNNKLLITN